jgi:hypothetical protein
MLELLAYDRDEGARWRRGVSPLQRSAPARMEWRTGRDGRARYANAIEQIGLGARSQCEQPTVSEVLLVFILFVIVAGIRFVPYARRRAHGGGRDCCVRRNLVISRQDFGEIGKGLRRIGRTQSVT